MGLLIRACPDVLPSFTKSFYDNFKDKSERLMK